MNGIDSDFIHLDGPAPAMDPVRSGLATLDSVHSSVIWNNRWETIQSNGPEAAYLSDAAFFALGIGEKLSAELGLGPLLEFHATGTRPRVLFSIQPGTGRADHFRTLCLATATGTDTHALVANLRQRTA